MEQKFKREFKSLDAIFDALGNFMATESVGEDATFAMNLAVEELFTNMVKYNSSGDQDIEITANIDDDVFVIRLIDFDVDPFDPAKLGQVNVQLPLGERKIGGLGLHIVQTIVDKITYEYEEGKMIVTVKEKLGPQECLISATTETGASR